MTERFAEELIGTGLRQGVRVSSVWKNKDPGINIAGTRFSSMVNDWEAGSFVARNVGGAGIVVLARAPNNYYFVTWSPGDVQIPSLNIHGEVAKMAIKFK